MGFKSLWKEQIVELLKMEGRNESEEILDKKLEIIFNRKFKDSPAILDNNYTNKKANTTLFRILDLVIDKGIIYTEHGSLYKQHAQANNRAALMLDILAIKRKEAKDKMFEAIEAKEWALANYYDVIQKVFKILMNSYYGVSALPSSYFFNRYITASVTGKGQSIISTAYSTFENALGDTFKFRNMDELVVYMHNIITEDINKKAILKDIPMTKKQVLERLVNKSKFKLTKEDRNTVIRILNSIKSKQVLLKLYYKNNIYEFFNLPIMTDMYEPVAKTEDTFTDPAKLSENTLPIIRKIWIYMEEYVLYNYIEKDKIKKFRSEERNVVLGLINGSAI